MKKILIITLNLIFLTTTSFAKTSYDIGTEVLEKEKQKKQEQRLQEPLSSVPVTKKKFESKEELEKIKFYIAEIVIHGNTVLPKKTMKKIINKYKGKNLSLNDISEFAHKLTNKYIEKGYTTTRVMIPNQNLKDTKNLVLNVVEGFVEEIIYVIDPDDGNEVDITKARRENMGFLEKLRVWAGFPIGKGNVLNTRKLDQGMDNYNRLASNNVQLFMAPGDQPGGTKVILKGKRKDLFRGSITYDNTGSVTTGQDKIRMQLEHDNLLGINDTITAYHISTKDTNALAFNYSVPFRNWLFTYDWTYSEYLSLIDNTIEVFGKVRNYSMTAYRTLFRDNKNKIGIKFVFNRKKSVRFYNDVQLNPQPLTILRGGLDYEYRGDRDTWYLELNYSKGVGYKAIIDDPNITNEEPHAQFEKLDAGITYYRALAERLNYKGTLKGQYSFDTLYSSEQIFLGGSDTVRGFIDSPSAGDTGVYMQNEISTKIGQTNIQPYIFADAGMTHYKAEDKKEYLSGAGVGVRYNVKKINFDASYGVPLYETDSVRKNNEGEFYASVTVKIF